MNFSVFKSVVIIGLFFSMALTQMSDAAVAVTTTVLQPNLYSIKPNDLKEMQECN